MADLPNYIKAYLLKLRKLKLQNQKGRTSASLTCTKLALIEDNNVSRHFLAFYLPFSLTTNKSNESLDQFTFPFVLVKCMICTFNQVYVCMTLVSKITIVSRDACGNHFVLCAMNDKYRTIVISGTPVHVY
jgi:hypothetical protein